MLTITRHACALGATAVLALGGTSATAMATTTDRGADGRHQAHHYDGSKGKHNEQQQRVSAWDEKWLQLAIMTDRFEIAGGQMAQRHAASEQVKAYGAHLVADHTLALQEKIELATRLGIKVPRAPSPEQQGIHKLLDLFGGPQFDVLFIDAQTKGHQQAILLTQEEATKGRNAEVRAKAAAELPVLQEHLKDALELGGTLAVDPLSD
jgi:putative membrane protein